MMPQNNSKRLNKSGDIKILLNNSFTSLDNNKENNLNTSQIQQHRQNFTEHLRKVLKN